MTKVYSVLYGEIEVCNLIKETTKGFRVKTEGVRPFEKMVYKHKKYAGGFLGSREYNTQRSYLDPFEALYCAQVQINERDTYLTNEECYLNAKKDALVKLNSTL